MRLASPALPTGAFAWSGGLEGAIAEGLVRDPATARAWIEDLLLLVHAPWDAAILWRLLTRPDARATWSGLFLASRETRELRAETLQIGKSLVDLLSALGHPVALDGPAPATAPAAWALAAEAWGVGPDDAVVAWLAAACEHQLAVLQKALPLGQVAAQRLLGELHPTVARAAAIATTIDDDDLTSSTPGLAIVSARHERQYCRLFRS
ncbi:MAG: urease accessory protein UreF [Deltaproteobacteria bacterium]|nr:urease accessory protein UreF [Deltaproteobacteria bacterium]